MGVTRDGVDVRRHVVAAAVGRRLLLRQVLGAVDLDLRVRVDRDQHGARPRVDDLVLEPPPEQVQQRRLVEVVHVRHVRQVLQVRLVDLAHRRRRHLANFAGRR